MEFCRVMSHDCLHLQQTRHMEEGGGEEEKEDEEEVKKKKI